MTSDDEGVLNCDPFAGFASWALPRLLGEAPEDRNSIVLPLVELFRQCAGFAAERADSAALELATRYNPDIRFDIYRLVPRVGPRMAQMAAGCPGVLQWS